MLHRRPSVTIRLQPGPGGLLELVEHPVDVLVARLVLRRPGDHARRVIAWFAGVTDGAQGPDISTIPSIALRQVEVLRDGASAQYGSDAIAGVINFLLKDDRSGGETHKSYAAFLAYVAVCARRSVREAARQYHSNTTATGEISSVEDTTVRAWIGWSSRHKWVSRANARDAWQARVSDEQIVVNLKACLLAMTTRAHGFLAAQDGGDFLRAARALALHFPG